VLMLMLAASNNDEPPMTNDEGMTKPECRIRVGARLGSACVSRVDASPARTFGVRAETGSFVRSTWDLRPTERFAPAGARSPARETRALPKQ
jgi:hypothetical protein